MSEDPSAAEPELNEPSLVQQAVSFGHAVARHVADGCQNVDERIYSARLAVCRDCPSCDVERLVCRECGCLLEMKARWGSEGCPRRKWDAIG